MAAAGRGATRLLALTLAPLVLGLLVSRLGASLPPRLLDVSLHALVALAGFEIGYSLSTQGWATGRGVLMGILLALTSLSAGTVVGLALGPLAGLEPCVSAAIAAASGWYTLAAPIVAAKAPEAAIVALASNMLREQLHLLLYPVLARLGLRIEAVALGGATTMDTGLPVVAAAGDPEAVAAAVAQGVTLTLALPLVLPLMVRLC